MSDRPRLTVETLTTARNLVLPQPYRTSDDRLPSEVLTEPCRVYSHGTDGWHCAIEGPHEEHANAAGDVTW